MLWLRNSDENRVLTFTRRFGNEEIIVAVNFSNEPFVGLIEGGDSAFQDITPDVSTPLLPGQSSKESIKKSVVALPALALDSWGYRVFKKVK